MSMDPSVNQRLLDVPRRTVSMRLGEGEAAGKFLSHQRQIIESALRHADMTPQEAAYAMGYANATPISKWLSGEPMQFARWCSVERLRLGLSIALGQSCPSVRVQTVLTVPHERQVAS